MKYYITLLTLLFTTAAVLTPVFVSYAKKLALLDYPEDRSSHTEVTPTGGGIIVLLTYLVNLLILEHQQVISTPLTMLLTISSLSLASVCFLDDMRSVSIKWRLAMQIIVIAIAVYYLQPDFVSQHSVIGHYLVLGLLVFSFLWLVNLYNFMDGIDGFASSEAIFICLSMSLLLAQAQQWYTMWLYLSLSIIVNGFLVWNWSPAKVFLGDTGSAFLGFILGCLTLLSVKANTNIFWPAIILFATFVADATVTLLRRMLTGQRFYHAHRSHVYQRLAKRFNSHAKVCWLYTAVNVLWLLPLAFCAFYYPQRGVLIATIAYFPLFTMAYVLDGGRELHH